MREPSAGPTPDAPRPGSTASPSQAPRRPGRRWLRWTLRGLLALVALLVLAVAGVLVWAQTPAGNAKLLSIALPLANDALAGKVEVGRLEFRGGHLVLRDVTLRTPEGERVAHVDVVEARVRYLALLRKTVHLDLARIEHPELWLVQDARGLNLMRAVASRHPTPKDPNAGPPGIAVEVSQARIERGAVAFAQEDVEDGPGRRVRLSPLDLEGSGRWDGPTGAIDADVHARGQLHEPVAGPLALALKGHLAGDRADGHVDLGLAGLALVADGRRTAKDRIDARLERLVVPPAVGRALTPAWSLRVPVTLHGDGGLEGNRVRARLAGGAGKGELALDADADLDPRRLRAAHLALRHVDLSELRAGLPTSDLALTADASGGGDSLETLTGKLDLAVPQSRVRGAAVGPVDVHATADRGAFALSQLRALLPGLRVEGQGSGTAKDVRATVDVQATDLAALGRTFGSLSATHVPPIAGKGSLAVRIAGPLRHPEVEAQGGFTGLRAGGTRVDALQLSASVPDVARPLDATARLDARELRAGERAFRRVQLELLTRGRALDLHAATTGALDADVHLGGVLDEDRKGLAIEQLSLRWPEEAWKLEGESHLRVDGPRLELAPLRLASGDQWLTVGGWKRGERLDASVRTERLDLGKLPHQLVPSKFALGGRLSLDARAHGDAAAPAVEASLDAESVQVGKARDLSARGKGAWDGRRARATLEARGLGTQLSADVDLPVEGLRRRRHEALSAKIRMPAFDVAQVLCAAVRAGLAPRGCDEEGRALATGRAELSVDASGYADAPVLKATAATHGLRYRELPPTDLTLALDAPERKDVSLTLQGTALQGTVDVSASLDRTLARLLSTRAPAKDLRGAPLTVKARVAGLQLEPLHKAGIVAQAVSGAVDLRADVAGTVDAPTGDVRLEAHRLAAAPMPPTEVALDVKAHERIDVTLEAHDASARLVQLAARVGASPAALQRRTSFDDVPVTVDGTVGPLDLSKLPVKVGGEGRQAKSLRGTAQATLQGRGTLQAPTLVLNATTSQLGAGDVPLGKAEMTLDYRDARTKLLASLASTNGGTLRLDSTVRLDASLPAIRRGLKPNEAPFQAALVAQRFDLTFLTGFTAAARKISGTLEANARADGTVGAPKAEGQLELKDAAVTLAGYGSYERIHVLANASNDHAELKTLEAHTRAGSLTFSASGDRDGDVWSLQGKGETDRFPIVSEDQLVATATLRTEITGEARQGRIELQPVKIPEAHIELPAEGRRNLQSLARPNDVLLLRNGVPLDKKRARAVLAQDPKGTAALGTDISAPESRPLQTVAVIDAPRNLWVKSPDLNIEIGLGQDFRVETGEETAIFGEVKVLRGRLDVLGRRFDLERNSVVRFTGPPTEPALDVTANYTNVREQVKVSMHVQGQGDDIALVPSSEPPLTESEIYTLLATGRTSLKRGGGGSSIGTAQVASALGSLAASQLKSVVSDKVGLDVLSVEGGDQGLLEGATLEAGKYLSDELYLGYAGKVGADPTRYENANAVRLEYQFLPRWSLEATYGDAKSGSADIVWSRDY